jgi:O-antigen/teichoic acid export membrane protein
MPDSHRGGVGSLVRGLRARTRTIFTGRGDDAVAQRVAATAFLIRVASAAIVYASQVLLARWMGSFEFGIYVYVWTWVLLIGAVIDLGLASSAQRFIPEYTGLRAFALLRGFLSAGRWFVIAVATLAAGLAAGVVVLAGPWLDSATALPLLLACLCLPFFALTHMHDGIARSCNWIVLSLFPPYILRPLLMLAIVAGAHAAGYAADAVNAMLAAVAATWATAVIQMLAVNRRLGRIVEPGPKATDFRTWLSVSLPIFMVESFYFLLTYTDILVLKQLRPADEVAVYFAASKTLALVAFVYFAVSAAAAHKFAQYHVAGDRERLAQFLMQSIRWTFWPSLAATALLLALGKPVLWMFGPEFVAGYPLMFVLAVGLLARAAIGPVERLLNMLGEQRRCALVYAAAFVVNLAACVILVPSWGTMGAAVATSLALVFESLLLFLVTRKRLGLHVFVWTRAGRG